MQFKQVSLSIALLTALTVGCSPTTTEPQPQPLVISITDGPVGTVSKRSATFAFTASGPAAYFECHVDAAPFTTCTSPVTVSQLAEGAHVFEVRGYDAATGTTSDPAQQSWTIDLTAPETVLVGSYPSFTSNTSLEVTFTASEPTATFECRLDDDNFAACQSPKALADLPEGAHHIDVRAVDAAGNSDPTPATLSWTVDRTPPETAIDTGPNELVGAEPVTFTFSANEANATFTCAIDSGVFEDCTSPLTVPALADGLHELSVLATDAAGNEDATPARRAWTVDTMPPDTTFVSVMTSMSSATFAFQANEPNCTFQCSFDGAAFTACSSPQMLTNLAEGSHTFAVRALDALKNMDETPASTTWLVDTHAPETSITMAVTPSNGQATSISFEADEAGCTFECSFDGATFAACTSPVTFATLADGSHSFAVRASDVGGNLDLTPASVSWAVDTTPPDTTLTSATVDSQSSNASFSFGATEPGGTFECRLDSAAYAPCTSPIAYSGLSDGNHSFAVRAIDAAGNVDPSPAAQNWTISPTALETTINIATTNITSRSASFAFSCNKPGCTFQCSLDGAAMAACTSPNSYSNLVDGPHTFAVRAADSLGNADQTPATSSWTVDATPPETTIASAPSGSVSSTSASISFQSSEAGSTFECSLDNAAFTTCTSPVSLSNLSVGSHSYRVQATDPAGNTDLSPAAATWTVVDGAIDTVLTSKPGLTSGQSVSFSFTATLSGGTFQCKLDSASFSLCTSPMSYSSLSLGSHTFQVRAVDSMGVADTSPESWTWQVQSGTRLRIVAANITSGSSQKYETPGMNILQGLHPDIVMLQEFNYGTNTKAEMDSFVSTTFGADFVYYRESTGSIPNGIISRYPILASGSWDDVTQSTREFAWAQIDLPNTTKDLWVISVHLKAGTDPATPPTTPSDAEIRTSQATALASLINANVPAADYVALGGDFNTQNRSEACVTAIAQALTLPSLYWVDQAGNTNTNGPRSKPYDWVLGDSDLQALQVPVVIGLNSFAHGLIFDSRVYSPLSDVSPVLQTDSGATNMQHMAVVRDFQLP